jgi:2-polyprenyl-6-methoxyphenol hydroxylase-like FAD-dependent oxidoreductase
LQYGKRLTTIDSDGKTVTVTFEDGSQEIGNLLIGTDGAHSRVREYLLGKEKAALISSPIVASATISRLPEQVVGTLRELHPRYCIAFHPDGYFNWVGSK